MNLEQCVERIRLVDEYSRLVTEFNDQLESLKAPSREGKEGVWIAAAVAREESDIAWEALEKHIAEHKCIDMPQRISEVYQAVGSGRVLERAALAAIDVIVVTDDDRRFIDVNEAAANAFGLPRSEIVGRRTEEFFAISGGKQSQEAKNDFISEGVQSGVCEMHARGRLRKFDFRSKANFAPGLHLSILREVMGSGTILNNLVGALIEELADGLPDDPSLETVRADLLAASRMFDPDKKTLRFYLSIQSLLGEHVALQDRLRRAEASKMHHS